MIRGFTSNEKLSEQEYSTIVPVGSGKAALDVAPKAMFPLSIVPVTPVSSRFVNGTNGNRSEQRIEITSHGMRVGDVLRFVSGLLINVESVVIKVIDSDNLVIGNVLSADASTSTCLKMRHVTLTLDSNGSLVTTSGPIQYALDGVPTVVAEDTVTPANNRPLPSGLFFMRDGVYSPVVKDTITPANTRPIPMELVSTNGVEATFNVTTGDLNIDTTHLGPNFDSIRVGDGTNLLGVNASNEALVHDADTLSELQNISAIDFATEAKQDNIITEIQALAATDFATETTLSGLAATDFATEAKQDNIITELQAIKNKTVDTVEDYYKRNFLSSPLTTVSGWVNLRTLTSAISRISITNNSGNELLIRNQTTNKSIIVGQGAVFNSPLIGAIADIIEIQALGADAVDGIIYINFEG